MNSQAAGAPAAAVAGDGSSSERKRRKHVERAQDIKIPGSHTQSAVEIIKMHLIIRQRDISDACVVPRWRVYLFSMGFPCEINGLNPTDFCTS